jgi:hypothetical protein
MFCHREIFLSAEHLQTIHHKFYPAEGAFEKLRCIAARAAKEVGTIVSCVDFVQPNVRNKWALADGYFSLRFLSTNYTNYTNYDFI